MKVKQLTFSALLIAIGTFSSHLIYLPIAGIAKCYPIQHTINVLSAILLGPYYAVINAFSISLLRNILGTGSILAFPGSMIGAFLAGWLYQHFHHKGVAVLGEVIGTGLLGALLSFPIASYLLGQKITAFFYVPSFLMSTLGGSIIGYCLLLILSPIANQFQGLALNNRKEIE